MVIKHEVDGYDGFSEFVKTFDFGGKTVFIYFSGKKMPSGENWCEDCRKAWPIVESELKQLDPDIHFVYVEVGDRPTWKDPSNPFRKDAKTKLMVIPTMIKWGTPQRLEGEQLEKQELVNMMLTFEDDD